MGSLFSTPDPPPQRSNYVYHVQETRPTTTSTPYRNLTSTNVNANQRLNYTSQAINYTYSQNQVVYHNLQHAYRRERNPLTPAVLKQSLAKEWEHMSSTETFKYIDVPENSSDFRTVEHLFNSTCRGKNLNVYKIMRLQNPYLLGCYLLKMEEMTVRNRGYNTVTEKYVFHGTKECNVAPISKDNLNWRLIHEHKFGHGVSFTPISYYASHYTDENATIKKMFLVRILVSMTVDGNKNMILPPEINSYSKIRYDTAKKPDDRVFVKFADNEVYPEYLIYYTGESAPRIHHKQNRQRRHHEEVDYY